MKWLIASAAVILFAGCKKTTSSPEIDNASLPVVEAGAVANITAYSINLSGRVAEMGGSSLVEAGFVLDTTHLPALDKHLVKITGSVDDNGNLLDTVTNLSPGTAYYFRMYAKNATGVSYSDEVSFSTLDEKTFTGEVVLTTQQQLDSFANEHYNRIKGTLTLYGYVYDLRPLSDLREVTKELNISFTMQLRTLDGLQNIKLVNTDKTQHGLTIIYNDVLENLKGLEGLTTVDGPVLIMKNYELISLEGLDNFKSAASGTLTIQDCDKLTTLRGLESLEAVDALIDISDNEVLNDVSALKKLSAVKDIQLSHNNHLEQIAGWQSLKTMGNLYLSYNPRLNSLLGLQQLAQMTSLYIDSNSLTTLSGLENLRSMGGLSINESIALTDLSALGGLQALDDLRLQRTGLKDLKGLEGLTNVFNIEIYDNVHLQSLEGLNHLKKVEFQLEVDNNIHLNNVQALSNLTAVSSGTYFRNNTVLSDFCPLKTALVNVPSANFLVWGNAANPTRDQVLTNCP